MLGAHVLDRKIQTQSDIQKGHRFSGDVGVEEGFFEEHEELIKRITHATNLNVIGDCLALDRWATSVCTDFAATSKA